MTGLDSGTQRPIRLRGVRVHNLQNVNLDIARGFLTVFCGVSGSGKTSLALDTLYAEGQRRYIESFSAYTRQFLQRLDRPDAESIEGIPPAVAVTRVAGSRTNRSTVATVTEVADYLRLLYAKIGELHCYRCGQPIVAYTAGQAAESLRTLATAQRLMVGFRTEVSSAADGAGLLGQLQSQGFTRVLIGDALVQLAEANRTEVLAKLEHVREAIAIVDRLRTSDDLTRITESLETCQHEGSGEAVVFIESTDADILTQAMPNLPLRSAADVPIRNIDGRTWWQLTYSKRRSCSRCDIEYDDPQPQLFSFNHPQGACPACEGFGEKFDLDIKKIVPDPGKSLREGAIAPWTTPAYRHELDELLALASDYDLPVDVPYRKLTARHRELIQNGVPERSFGGLKGFFAWLERRKYKLHIRVFLSRWRSYRRCEACAGKRLKPESLAYTIAGRSIAETMALSVPDAMQWASDLTLSERDQQIAHELIAQVVSRLTYLKSVGLGYLTLDRSLRTLSGGETQRVALTSALGSHLVNMLYVLDEPTAGLHPSDVDRLVTAVHRLRDRGNTVIAVEHHETMIQRADWIVELGPHAGTEGGRIVYEGNPLTFVSQAKTLTAGFLSKRQRGRVTNAASRSPYGWLELSGASGNNLQNLDVRFPLGVLCVVTGVSGSGKSTLVQETLYGALCKRKKQPIETTLPYQDLRGASQVEAVVLIDQSPLSRSPRSNPATYSKAFDPIRSVFAATVAARTHNYTDRHFSFNVEGGRCEACQGDGCLKIDMQFLADITMRCPECQGTRYRKEILAVRYRDRNIAEVLEMSIREAVDFFRSDLKIQERLQRLLDVGLGYLSLGQPCSTLSTGEAQRLKLAGFLAAVKKRRTLFLLDEPTAGLHFADILRLQECFNALLQEGHSLLVVEHHLQLIQSADWIIDLGPGAAEAGGRVVVAGTPEDVAGCPESVTGKHLALFMQSSKAER